MGLTATIYPDRIARIVPRNWVSAPENSPIVVRWAASRLKPDRPRGTTCGIEAVMEDWDIYTDVSAAEWQTPNDHVQRDADVTRNFVLVFTALMDRPGGITLRHRRDHQPGAQGLTVEFDPAGFRLDIKLASDVPSFRNAPPRGG